MKSWTRMLIVEGTLCSTHSKGFWTNLVQMRRLALLAANESDWGLAATTGWHVKIAPQGRQIVEPCCVLCV